MPNWVKRSLVLLVAVFFAGCGMSRSHPPRTSDAVSVETPAQVAGVWKGNTGRLSYLWSDGDLMVSIAPGGSYVVWSDRGPTPAVEAGRLFALEGQLISDRQGLISTVTVVKPHDEPTLVPEVNGKDGTYYYVPLSR
ncbi:hypothetical protein [Nitrospira sp. Nam74]